MDGGGLAPGWTDGPQDADDRVAEFLRVRAHSLALAAPLGPEDQQVQSMPDVSPTKWHLAHTTWFFETFVLQPHCPGYEVFDPQYRYLFNSYYEGVGPRHPRAERGLISRPGLAEVHAYRAHVDAAMASALPGIAVDLAELVTLGLQHEQQHQELILMDIQHVLSRNPLQPAYAAAAPRPEVHRGPAGWRDFAGGLHEIGADAGAGAGFTFDNEGPRHKVWLEPFRLADRLVTQGEWLAFIEDDGYRRPDLWLSDGWAAACDANWDAPLYWTRAEGGWRGFTLAGAHDLDPDAPVAHVSFYEADAFARWRGARLPTEAEWEVAALAGAGLNQMHDVLWQWTASAYAPYPRFRPAAGALGEYNGKFMSGQMVLRGGAFATPAGHSRTTYRNFFPPAGRWCFGGVRLADDA